MTILLSLTIFLNTVSEIIPITSDSPLIGKLPFVDKSVQFIVSCRSDIFCYLEFSIFVILFLYRNITLGLVHYMNIMWAVLCLLGG